MAEPAADRTLQLLEIPLDGPDADRVGYVRRIQNAESNEERLPRLDADQDVGHAHENNQSQVEREAAVRRDQAAARQRRHRQNELPQQVAARRR